MTISDNYVYPSMEVSKIDNLAIEQEGIPGFVLMKRAADFSYKSAIECYPNTNSFIVICGLGNNAFSMQLPYSFQATKHQVETVLVHVFPYSSSIHGISYSTTLASISHLFVSLCRQHQNHQIQAL